MTEVAAAGGIQGYVSTTSGDLAERLDVSQQTASRWIRSLTEDGYLDRRLGSRGQQLRLTEEGIELLTEQLERLERIFQASDETRITGTVAEGDGEGAYYMSQPFYRKGFEELFGFTPFPGTLNLEVEGEDLQALGMLRNRQALEIPKVKTDERTFGGVTGYPAEVEDRQAAVIFPHRTRHERVLEVIAPNRLRDELGLEDGDTLTVLVDARPGDRTYNPQPDLEG